MRIVFFFVFFLFFFVLFLFKKLELKSTVKLDALFLKKMDLKVYGIVGRIVFEENGLKSLRYSWT